MAVEPSAKRKIRKPSLSACPKGEMNVAAVVLAAGRSSRMGRVKQLLPLPGGITVLESVVTSLAPHVEQVLVVVGHPGGQVAIVAEGAGAHVIVNHNVDLGMLVSVQQGIGALRADVDGVLLCIGDQPAMDASLIESVLTGAARNRIVIPVAAGHGGHPVFVARAFFAEILSLAPDTPGGLRRVVRGYPEKTLEIEVGDRALLQDMDTPVDYEREFERLQQLERRTRT